MASEASLLAYLRILGDFHNVKDGISTSFQGNFRLFWIILTVLVIVHFILLVLKYFLTNICMVMDSSKAHEGMIDFFLKGPTSFFDLTPTGLLTNKFTTDLGVLDNSLIIAFIDSLEGPVLVAVAIGNMIHIDPWFAVPCGVLAVIIFVFFVYSRPAFIACKQLDLQIKAPVFHFYSETIHGLTQIKFYNRRKPRIA